jgi:hypothetical protein
MKAISMALKHRIFFLPEDAERVSDHPAVTRHDGQLTFVDASGPSFTCREDDEGGLRFTAAMLSEPDLGLATPTQVARVLGRHRSRVARAERLLDEGQSNRPVAGLAGVSEGTIRKAIREGRLFRAKREPETSAPAPEELTASTPRQRSDEDASSAGGVATKRPEERALAATWLLVEGSARLVPAQSVAEAGCWWPCRLCWARRDHRRRMRRRLPFSRCDARLDVSRFDQRDWCR